MIQLFRTLRAGFRSIACGLAAVLQSVTNRTRPGSRVCLGAIRAEAPTSFLSSGIDTRTDELSTKAARKLFNAATPLFCGIRLLPRGC